MDEIEYLEKKAADVAGFINEIETRILDVLIFATHNGQMTQEQHLLVDVILSHAMDLKAGFDCLIDRLKVPD